MAAATALKEAARATGNRTAEIDRKRLTDGMINWSPSGALRDPVFQEDGVAPLKAIHQITYGAGQTAFPGMVFIPVSAAERKDLLEGTFPAAEEPGPADLALFDKGSDFG